jgi:hypothetical protein
MPPAANGDPFASEYKNQIHVGYLANGGTIREAWYSAFPRPGKWNEQRVDKDDSDRNKYGDIQPWLSIGAFLNQQHFCYIRRRFAAETGAPEPRSNG